MRKITSLFFMFCSAVLFAQEDEVPSWFSKLSFSGSVDAYYRTNINSINKFSDPDGEGLYMAPGSSFANRPGFALGMANTVFSYEGEKVGAVADLVFGPRGEDAVFNSTGNSSIVNQLYVYWNVSDNVTLTFGNWNTFLGYEVISPTANFNYSTSYMFSYGPFSHTGIKADFAIDDNWSAMLAVMNATDFTEFNPNGSYSFGGQLGYTSGSGSTFLNVLVGDQDGNYEDEGLGENNGTLFQVDLTTGYDLTDTFYLGFNTTYNTTSYANDGDYNDYGFYGFALYAQLALSDTFSLGVRPEYFSEFGEYGAINQIPNTTFYDEGDADVFAVTLSGNVKIGELTLIPELRMDTASEDAFFDRDLESQKSLGSFVLAAVYSF
ncbi:porin [Flavimarina sp. Hel_I_48]|uniref:porin n=1 Tax=Flavimarina sp. Hel_I_48 TaxID=1392488 RepID=UPI0004DEFFDE|nr:porin [Flavimarina sp. Hel_I_48]